MTDVRIRQSRSVPIIIKKDDSLTDKQMEDIIESFTIIDINGDGRLSKTELLKAASLTGMNPTMKDIDAMMQTADLDGDGFISFHEYKNMMKEKYTEDNIIDLEQERLLVAFKVLDKDNDGFISKKELKYALHFREFPISESEIDTIISEADRNGDGFIDYKEFIKSKLCTKFFA